MTTATAFQLTDENYYADRHYMSATRLRGYLECPARQRAIDHGEWVEEETDAIIAGKMVHAMVEGPEAYHRFLEQYHDRIANKKGDLYAPFKQAEQMGQALLADSFIQSMLVGKHEQIVTATLFGVPWKSRIDVLHPARIVDLKTVTKLSEREWNKDEGRWMNWVEARGYLMQLAIYAEVVRIAYGEEEWRQPLIVAVTKEDPPDKAVIAIDDGTIEEELAKVKAALPTVMDMVHGIMPPERCEKCKYCRSTKQVRRIIMWQDLAI
jgi:hypothetical protein